MLIRARHYATGELIDLAWTGGRIASIAPAGGCRPDCEAGWVAPALFDLQINGCLGRNFSSQNLTPEDVRQVVDSCREHGIGAFCPTLVTNSFAALAHGFATLRRAWEMDAAVAEAVPGFHLEGPYISAEDGPRGAHTQQHVRPPDWDEFQRFQDAAGGRILLVTLAPETPGALAFIEKLTAAGVVVSIGHTSASGSQIRDAIRAGARLSTHLGNGSHALLPRHDNYLWAQLAADDLWASTICDGRHLPQDVVRCVLRVKSPARMILTCDASPLAGLPPGRYGLWDQEFDVLADGSVAVPGTTYLAGSGVFTDACVQTLLNWGEASLTDAIDMASTRPRQLLRLPAPGLVPGAATPLMLFDWQPAGPFRVTGVLSANASSLYNGEK